MIIANVEDYRKQCEARLPRFLYDYISGGSFQENTLRANMAELQARCCARKNIEWVRSVFPGKIILKGILDPEDASALCRQISMGLSCQTTVAGSSIA
jgi:isopentenyl diphosphate isomerase/L-lactate dehydrogenase-like FMN-dependent dehydrogenase